MKMIESLQNFIVWVMTPAGLHYALAATLQFLSFSGATKTEWQSTLAGLAE